MQYLDQNNDLNNDIKMDGFYGIAIIE